MSVTIRQEIPIVVGGQVTGASDDTHQVQLDTTQYVSPTYYFEIVAKIASGSENVTLRRLGTTTDDATIAVTGSTTFIRFRSAAFTPPAGQTTYMIHCASTVAVVSSARIIVIDSPTTLTSSETQIEVGNWETAKTNTAAAALTNPKYWLYTAALWDGTKTFFAEVTYSTSSTNTATITLQEDNGSFASWVDKVTIVSAVSHTTPTRLRSIAFTPTDGRNYRLAAKSSTTKSNYSIYNAKIIVDQNIAIDSYSESHSKTTNSLNSTSNFGFGQSFTGNGQTISAAKWYIDKSGSPTGNATANIYTHSGTFGTSSVPTGAALATSDSFDVSTLSTSLALATFNFSGVNQITLTDGTHYVLTIEYSGGNGANTVLAGEDNSSPTASGNSSFLFGGSWTAASAVDYPFYVLSTTSSITLLEPQYLLLNTANSGTGLQSFPTLIDTTNEWSGVTNVYKHAMDSNNALNVSKLEDITTTTILTTSAVTGANQQISSDMSSQLVSGDQLDTDILTAAGVIAASRILVGVTVSSAVNVSIAQVAATVTFAGRTQTALGTVTVAKLISDMQNTAGLDISVSPTRASYY